jgi:hypothetical protein
MEFRIKGIALIGEVIHREEAGSKWQVGVKAEHPGGAALSDDELDQILNPL